MSNINVALTEKELQTAISGLLFSCSVNIVSNTNLEHQTDLLQLAKKLKELKPDIKLTDIQFVKEDDYEDETSPLILEAFGSNIEITSFEHV
jgi:hypothetical protein